MPRMKQKKKDYDFTKPLKVSITGKNLPYIESPQNPPKGAKSGNPLNEEKRGEHFSPNPAVCVRRHRRTFKAGNGKIVVIPGRKIVIPVEMRNREEVESISTWGDRHTFLKNGNMGGKFLVKEKIL